MSLARFRKLFTYFKSKSVAQDTKCCWCSSFFEKTRKKTISTSVSDIFSPSQSFFRVFLAEESWGGWRVVMLWNPDRCWMLIMQASCQHSEGWNLKLVGHSDMAWQPKTHFDWCSRILAYKYCPEKAHTKSNNSTFFETQKISQHRSSFCRDHTDEIDWQVMIGSRTEFLGHQWILFQLDRTRVAS